MEQDLHPHRMAVARSIDNSTPEKLCAELSEFINDAIEVAFVEGRMLSRIFLHTTSGGEQDSSRIYCSISNHPIQKDLK